MKKYFPAPRRAETHHSRHCLGGFIIWKKRGAPERFIEMTGAGATLWALIDGRRSRRKIENILKNTFCRALNDDWIDEQFRTLRRLQLLRRDS